MLEAGIIQPSQSYFFAPIVLVHKNGGSWYMCLDYRELNKLTIKDKISIPPKNKFPKISWNQMNIKIMIMNRWEDFGSLKHLGMIFQGFLEIWINRGFRCLNL